MLTSPCAPLAANAPTRQRANAPTRQRANAPTRQRANGTLSRRTSVALQHAFAQASDRGERYEVVKILHTVSDGADLLRMEVEGQRPDLRLAVEAQIGAGLGPLLSKRIRADVEVTVKWHAASGRETRSYRLLHAEAAPRAQSELPSTDGAESPH